MCVEFRINDKQKIIIKYNDIEEEKELSNVSVYLVNNNLKINIANDSLIEVIQTFYNCLNRVIQGEGIDNKVTSIGYEWNNWAYDLPEEGQGEEDEYEDFWIWSSKDTGTWLYRNINQDIILEISPIYRWLFQDADYDENYISFKQFKSSYKVTLIKTLHINLVIEWKEQCELILSKLR
jgi:hypothetical protein